MAITDLLFLFLFLPLSLLAYYFCKEKYQEPVLLAVSLIFYACGSRSAFLILCVSIGINILIGWLIDKSRDRKRMRAGFLILGVIYNLSILGYYKYTDLMLSAIGISFFTFKAISYLADVYGNKIELPRSPIRAALYLSFFAQVQSGPLSRYRDMEMDRRGGVRA